MKEVKTIRFNLSMLDKDLKMRLLMSANQLGITESKRAKKLLAKKVTRLTLSVPLMLLLFITLKYTNSFSV